MPFFDELRDAFRSVFSAALYCVVGMLIGLLFVKLAVFIVRVF